MDRCRVGCWELGEWTGTGWVVGSYGDLIRSWGEWTEVLGGLLGAE